MLNNGFYLFSDMLILIGTLQCITVANHFHFHRHHVVLKGSFNNRTLTTGDNYQKTTYDFSAYIRQVFLWTVSINSLRICEYS